MPVWRLEMFVHDLACDVLMPIPRFIVKCCMQQLHKIAHPIPRASHLHYGDCQVQLIQNSLPYSLSLLDLTFVESYIKFYDSFVMI